MAHSLEINHLSVSFNGKDILHDLHFQAETGQLLAIIGPNGAGKTTLLKVILGLIQPQTGSCTFASGKRPVIGYVPQVRPIDEEMPITVRDFIALGLSRSPLPWLSRKEREDLKKTMALTQMDHLAGQAIGKLSGGERQRAYLGQALVRNPELLLLDESTASLDPQAQGRMMQLVQRICREQKLTVLFISHNLRQVIDYADRVLLIAQGKYTQGRPQEIIGNKKLMEIFYDRPASFSDGSDHRLPVTEPVHPVSF